MYILYAYKERDQREIIHKYGTMQNCILLFLYKTLKPQN